MPEKRQKYFLLGFDLFTLLLWGWVLAEFFSHGAIRTSGTVVNVYLLVLVFYAGDKEIRRWRRRHQTRQRHGEFFVYGWVATGIFTYCLERFGDHAVRYHVPEQLPLIIGSVVVIYIITELLKAEFRTR
ncbi:MAG: hypothetical protein V1898_00845 [Patescibacteria group bacterium]